MRRRLRILLGVLAVLAVGCQSGPTGALTTSGGASGGASGGGSGGGGVGEQPVAYVAGQAVRMSDLRTPMLEAGGGQVLAEVALDRLVAERLRERGLTLTPGQIEAERQRVLQTLSEDEDQAVRLLAELRQRRGLGEERFAMLLRRNAGLRLLVQDEVRITPESLRQAYVLEYGPRYRARILVVPSLQQASRLREQIEAGGASGGASFGELAALHSTDASAAQGGLLSPISPADPSYPQVIRDALVELSNQPRPVSHAIALDGGFALLRLERKIEAQQVEFDDVKEELTARVQRRIERTLTEQLARRLLDQAKVVVLDPALSASWGAQRQLLLSP